MGGFYYRVVAIVLCVILTNVKATLKAHNSSPNVRIGIDIPTTSSSSSSPNKQFFHVSDIHLDVSYGTNDDGTKHCHSKYVVIGVVCLFIYLLFIRFNIGV